MQIILDRANLTISENSQDHRGPFIIVIKITYCSFAEAFLSFSSLNPDFPREKEIKQFAVSLPD